MIFPNKQIKENKFLYRQRFSTIEPWLANSPISGVSQQTQQTPIWSPDNSAYVGTA